VSRRKYSIRFLRIAEDNLVEITAYISADRPSATEALAAKIEKSLQLLSQNLHLGGVLKEDELAGLHYRYLVVDNYLIFYTVEGQTIYVHRIVHGARDFLNVI